MHPAGSARFPSPRRDPFAALRVVRCILPREWQPAGRQRRVQPLLTCPGSMVVLCCGEQERRAGGGDARRSVRRAKDAGSDGIKKGWQFELFWMRVGERG